MSKNTEIEGKVDLSIIRYSQCWEDTDILLEGLDIKEREEFVEELYDIVKRSMQANKLNDISENRLKMTYRFFKKVGSMEDDKREMMQNTVMKLIQSGSEIKKEEKNRQKKHLLIKLF